MEVIALLIVEKSTKTFSWNFWFSNGWVQTDVIFEAEGCIILTINSPPPICWVSYRWPVGINIVKPCLRKVAGSGINERYFQASVAYTCCLLFINKDSTNSVHIVPQVCGTLVFLVFMTHYDNCFLLGNFFHDRDRKLSYVNLHELSHNSYFTLRWMQDSTNL